MAKNDNIEVKLTVSRAGAVPQAAGQVISVGLAEASRMLAAGQIEKPAEADLKRIVAYRDAQAGEVAQAAKAAKADKPAGGDDPVAG